MRIRYDTEEIHIPTVLVNVEDVANRSDMSRVHDLVYEPAVPPKSESRNFNPWWSTPRASDVCCGLQFNDVYKGRVYKLSSKLVVRSLIEQQGPAEPEFNALKQRSLFQLQFLAQGIYSSKMQVVFLKAYNLGRIIVKPPELTPNCLR